MTYVPAELRRLVIKRAGNCCEYCRMSLDDRLMPFEIDHVIAEKHRGTTTVDNLCLACYRCNGFKGSDISSVDEVTDVVTPLFNPRRQNWDNHFRLKGAIIDPLTPEGRVTVFLLRLNTPSQIAQRAAYTSEGRYPCQKASETE